MTMTATETLNALAQAGPVLRAIPGLVKAIEFAAGLEGAIAERQRELAALGQQLEDAKTAETSRAARALGEHETAQAERQMDLVALDAKIADRRRELGDLEGELGEARAFVETQRRVKADLTEHLRKMA